MSEYVIETRDLSKKYGDILAVNDVSLHIKEGEIYGLLGRNGAGKTTIMKMLLGLSYITQGSVSMFGESFSGNERKFLNEIGVMIETPGFYPNLTATENLEILASLREIKNPSAVKESLDQVGLQYKDKKLFSEFSLGMKQRLGIAAAIIHDPKILILDEPINGLDPIGVAETRKFLKELSRKQGKTILLSSHILSEIELVADSIGIIHGGVLLEESSYEKLKEKNTQYIALTAVPIEEVIRILEESLNIRDYQRAGDNTIHIPDTGISTKEIVKLLANQKIYVDIIDRREDSLEDYFKRITGGVGIA